MVALAFGHGQAALADEGSRLQYFGFSGGCDSEAYLQETAPFSNLCVIDIEDERLLDHSWVTKMMVREMRLVVITHGTFFEAVEVPGQPPSGFDLRPNASQRWQQALAGKEAALDALLAFFYVADEPGWNGISRSELETAVLLIKQSMPRARTATSFSHMLDTGWFEGQDVPTDAVAYHQYAVLDPRIDPDYQANLSLIKSHAPGKDFLYVLDSWWSPMQHGEVGLTPQDMTEVAENYYLMASEDPDAVGVVGFYWPSFSEGTGARDLPSDVRWRYWSIGSQITGKCLGPAGVDAATALFFDDCSYFATFEYETPDGTELAIAMPRERSYGTWVLDEGDVVGGLKIDHGDELAVYPSFYTDRRAVIRIYDAADGHIVWRSEPRAYPNRSVVRLPYGVRSPQ